RPGVLSAPWLHPACSSQRLLSLGVWSARRCLRHGKTVGCDMSELDVLGAPALTALQLAWLEEVGLDKRMLARYAANSGRTDGVSAPAVVIAKPMPEP